MESSCPPIARSLSLRRRARPIAHRTVIIAAFLVAAVIAPPSVARSGEQAMIKRGFAIAPVTLNLKHKDRTLVGLGSYLVNAVAGCVGCHTFPKYEPGGNPFLGQPKRINRTNYLAGGRCFGPFMSTNITPDGKGLPAGLTWAQFREMIRTGSPRSRDNGKGGLERVMPWPTYAKMTDHDLRAIYEYLNAIPQAKPRNTSCPPPAPH